jgi:hypothetical protein
MILYQAFLTCFAVPATSADFDLCAGDNVQVYA